MRVRPDHEPATRALRRGTYICVSSGGDDRCRTPVRLIPRRRAPERARCILAQCRIDLATFQRTALPGAPTAEHRRQTCDQGRSRPAPRPASSQSTSLCVEQRRPAILRRPNQDGGPIRMTSGRMKSGRFLPSKPWPIGIVVACAPAAPGCDGRVRRCPAGRARSASWSDRGQRLDVSAFGGEARSRRIAATTTTPGTSRSRRSPRPVGIRTLPASCASARCRARRSRCRRPAHAWPQHPAH